MTEPTFHRITVTRQHDDAQEVPGQHYGLQERPRLGVWEVIDVDDPEAEPLFVGLKDDCREWIELWAT